MKERDEGKEGPALKHTYVCVCWGWSGGWCDSKQINNVKPGCIVISDYLPQADKKIKKHKSAKFLNNKEAHYNKYINIWEGSFS